MVKGAGPEWEKYACEFVGTFFLVFTVGCNVLGGNPVWGVTSIACTLMVCIYAMGSVSGGHFNPAVTVAVALTMKMDSWLVAGSYMLVQTIAGTLAGFCYKAMFGWQAFNLEPGAGHNWLDVMIVEVLYTYMLCFVVLCTACAKANNETGQFYGLAIGFVVVAGGYAAGSVSGGCFNPAVAFGIDISSREIGFGWCFAYLGYELAGAALAALSFYVVYPEEFRSRTGEVASVPRRAKVMFAEFIGTFFLVFTVGCNVLSGSPAGAWSIAASLMCMIYALGKVSGAHFNPAVTLSILLCGRKKITPVEAGLYVVSQLCGGLMGALTYSLVMGKVFALAPGPKYGWVSVGVAEIIFTFLLCFVVLNVATVREPSRDMFGLAIGSCVTVGGFAIGAISGGSLNPAVSFGIDTVDLIWGGSWKNCLFYTGFELIGAALASGLFYGVRPREYSKADNLASV